MYELLLCANLGGRGKDHPCTASVCVVVGFMVCIRNSMLYESGLTGAIQIKISGSVSSSFPEVNYLVSP